jgi:hypothetical protein
MPQAIEISSKKNTKKAEKLAVANTTEKTPFQKEWEKGISIEEMRTNLLKKVHARWNEKLALAKK